jgi:predicted alpha/beta hydrolase family esterase
MTYLILPGLYGSGPDHWQSWWLKSVPGSALVEQHDWERPRLEAWRERVAAAVEAHPGAILVAHSLAVALVARLASWRPDLPVGGALLVAPADVDDATWTTPAVAAFGPMPLERLPFPAIVVAAQNDPYVSFARAEHFAAAWGADLVDLGEGGHINPDHGFGAWPDGVRLAERLRAQSPARDRDSDDHRSDDDRAIYKLSVTELLAQGYSI